MTSLDTNNADYWLGRARRLTYFVNVVGWLERFLPAIIVLNVVACCAVLFLRGQEIDIRAALWALLACIFLTGVGLAIWWRKRGLSLFATLLRIETAMRLDNRLTTAYEGHVPWPAPRQVPAKLYDFRWQRPVWAALLSCAFLLAALIVPINYSPSDPLAENPAPPLALSEVENWIEQIREEEIVEDSSLEKLRQAVEELKGRPSDEWYTAGALEAADSLNEQVASALSTLAHELQTSSALLQGVENLPDSIPPAQLSRLSEVYRESVNNLEMGALPLSSEMLDKMKGMDFSQLGNMDPKALEDLQARSEMMAQAARMMSEMSPEEQERLDQYYENLKEGMCEGGPDRGMVPGGIGRGRDDAEMSYSPYRSPDEGGRMEGVSNQDMSQAAIADTIRTNISQQKEDSSGFAGPSQGGTIDSVGEGGDAVWVDRLTPDERKVLQNYFK
mgnify:CR=1 FL=1